MGKFRRRDCCVSFNQNFVEHLNHRMAPLMRSTMRIHTASQMNEPSIVGQSKISWRCLKKICEKRRVLVSDRRLIDWDSDLYGISLSKAIDPATALRISDSTHWISILAVDRQKCTQLAELKNGRFAMIAISECRATGNANTVFTPIVTVSGGGICH
jgi:hypothetical protein